MRQLLRARKYAVNVEPFEDAQVKQADQPRAVSPPPPRSNRERGRPPLVSKLTAATLKPVRGYRLPGFMTPRTGATPKPDALVLDNIADLAAPEQGETGTAEAQAKGGAKERIVVEDKENDPGAANSAGQPEAQVIFERVAPAQLASEEEELRQFARHLGLSASDSSVRWFVQAGLCSPLPPFWSGFQDEEGRIFYWNESTQESCWEHPLDSQLQVLGQWLQSCGDTVRRCRKGGDIPRGLQKLDQAISTLSTATAGLKTELKQLARTWSGPHAAEVNGKQQPYWYHKGLDKSVWQDPRASVAHFAEITGQAVVHAQRSKAFLEGLQASQGAGVAAAAQEPAP
eukprot:CAMPEP_0204316630 /NCGR_PEP_ID=MMETSP0469-20131031/5507_1 /ASSEMBLY_ACC=CAM_ASM_000384 /TAXON_ID=2969 /ORGANISM="Oxyrrhis marina" /LENGTH=342 /DNA_ID=CAMNT_0051297431 /DNA_START=99 /DNA_END=1124 /DNA_ORIENTATION=-